LYTAILADTSLTKRSDMDHTVLPAKITPCLPFPSYAFTRWRHLTEVADIQLQLTTNLSTSKGWKA